VFSCSCYLPDVPPAWDKPGAADANLKRDRYECSQESRVGPVAPSDETRVFFYGTNKLAQSEANRLYRLCMEARGWTAVERK
jgi:hypothetical protein